MAIKVSGTTVIDDNKNIVGAGITINSITGDINTVGIITAAQLNISSGSLVSYSTIFALS